MPRRTDFLIVGSGIAGLRAAADLARAGDVLVLTKANPSESNTDYAQGGIAAAVGPGDTPEQHAADTIAAEVGERPHTIVCDVTTMPATVKLAVIA